jgi:hypothetical protein
MEGDVIYAPQKMKESSFLIDPFLDASLIEFSSSEILYLSHIDPNTLLSTTEIQVGVINTIQLIIRDVFGNEFTESNDISFNLAITPFSIGATTIYASQFNPSTKRYEFYYTPTKSGSTYFEIYEVNSLQQISGSPATKIVIAGKYNPNHFTLTENHSTGVCYIALECGVRLTMFDSYDNQIYSSGIIDFSEFDSILIGPLSKPDDQITDPLTDITENAGLGTFDIKFRVITSGVYQIYIRINALQILDYPFNVEAVSNKALAANSYIVESPLNPIIAGSTLTLTLYVLDEFNNLSIEENIPIEANMTLDASINYIPIVTKVSTGVYRLVFEPIVRGSYTMHIKIFDQTETYGYVKNFPQTQIVYPHFISLVQSTVAGTGLSSGRFGFIETYTLQLKDKYGNNYNYDEIFYDGINNPVYKIEYLADDIDPKIVLTMSTNPDQGTYDLAYRIVNAYSELYIRIWLFVTADEGVTFSYQPIDHFPIVIPIVFSPGDLLDEYTNLYQGGIGITEKSISTIVNTVVAGSGLTKFMEIYPKNTYSLTFNYDEIRDYIIVNIIKVSNPSEYCLCEPLEKFSTQKIWQAYNNASSLAYSLKNCRKFSFGRSS